MFVSKSVYLCLCVCLCTCTVNVSVECVCIKSLGMDEDEIAVIRHTKCEKWYLAKKKKKYLKFTMCVSKTA